ncbi:MAG: hypothetical protein ABEK16_00995 [Candidatus Nanohalobium sp.]
MKLDDKLRYAVIFEVFLTAAVISLIYLLPESQVSAYRLWEVFPALMAATLTTFGLKEMKEKT